MNKTKSSAKSSVALTDESAAPTYTLEKLKSHSMEIFSVSESIFTGATTGLAEQEYTVSEIKDTIAKWLKMEAR